MWSITIMHLQVMSGAVPEAVQGVAVELHEGKPRHKPKFAPIFWISLVSACAKTQEFVGFSLQIYKAFVEEFGGFPIAGRNS